MVSITRYLLIVVAAVLPTFSAQAADKSGIEALAAQALANLRGHVSAAGPLLDEAAGVLVFPDVVKVGFGGAEEYGEGCLMVGDKPVAYYATAGASYGLPLGVQTKSEVVLFMDQQTLEAFRSGADWKVGTDGEVTLVRAAAGASVDGATAGEPILGFVFTDKGLVDGLTLEGARFSRLAR